MKFAIRPKKRPIGIAAVMMSENAKSGILRARVNNRMAIVTPSAPPWNDIPPCQT